MHTTSPQKHVKNAYITALFEPISDFATTCRPWFRAFPQAFSTAFQRSLAPPLHPQAFK
jgi:hypothetical protein